uniref:Fibrohexamerin homolog2 n=1 Tax=Samia ricini TaxID=63990 RepID=A0A0M3VH85_SAMRI|nr:fibrohexamerin homolog2 [Samia ricini]
MKKNLVFLFSLIGYCVCINNDCDIESTDRISQNNHDFEDDCIVHPCNISDTKCIRNFFATHGHCTPMYGPVPDPFRIELMILLTSTSNISVTIADVQVSGLNGEITSFYINKKTNNLVIAFEAKNVTVSSPRITFIYNRKGKEPIRLTDGFFITYSSVTYTATIPNIKNLQLSEAYVYAYLHDNDPNFCLGPGIAQSNDPVVIKEFNDVLKKMGQIGKEASIIQARNFMNVFIQNNICDFGLNITY